MTPLVFDDTALTPAALDELFRSLRGELRETEEQIAHPRGKVLEPVGLETAGELVRSARAVLDGPGATTPEDLAHRANLAYAVLLAAVDLMKSHTDVPKVPRSAKASATT